MKNLSFDVISNGRGGKVFAIGAIIYDNGKEMDKFYARCPIDEKIDVLTQDILSNIERLNITHSSYKEMVSDFANFYLANKDCYIIIGEEICKSVMVIQDMYNFSFICDIDFPKIVDVTSMLHLSNNHGQSVESYNRKHNIQVPIIEEGKKHNPLYNAREIAFCYMELKGRT